MAYVFSFIQQIFEHLLCARNNASAKDTGMNKMGKILNILVRGRYGTDNIQTNIDYIRCQCLLRTLK